jgi:hypothetical protein
MQKKVGRLCGLVVRGPGYRTGDPGSIPGATRFSEQWVCNGGSPSLVSTIEELLGKRSGYSLENREYGSRDQSR